MRTIDLATNGLELLRNSILSGPIGRKIPECARLILGSSGRVIVVGMGKSGHIARKLAATFSSTGTPAHFVHPAEASHGDLGMIGKDDIIVALSWSGETAELASVLTYARRFNIPLLAVTSGANSTLAANATIAMILPKVQEACPNGLAPTTSTLLMLALGDALAMEVLAARGFTADDFHSLHPGGKLGAQLSYVDQLMHTGDRMPLVAIGSKMAKAVTVMTERGFGVVGVTTGTGELAGIITDGDIRRHMSDRMLQQKVDTVMTRGPKVVKTRALASAALTMMQANRISVLFVVDGRRPIGVIHMLDLLRVGVA